MAQPIMEEMNDEERAELERVEKDANALGALVEDLASASRRKRQFAARVVSHLAAEEPELIAGHIDALIDALYRPEAQTRWEVLDALTCLVPTHAKEVGAAFEGAEAALFDELSSTLRFSAFNFLVTWGASERGRSKKVWPILDEAIQCYHGDLEYRDMLACLLVFAEGKIAGEVADELAGRLQFDAQNGKGAFIKSRSAEIYDMLVKRFKLKDPKKRARVTPKDDEEEDEEE
ncbi:hypothetical protein [Collinsella sp. An268]|uniref:hypothetical protein n=1 Tax=Collinsella sp. An268 TaxID=1965612 RepID=UPI000B39DED6|nr:hypothetical protein [Collinsella sp. An268]OUO64388.1 hypothetical protein B5F70_05815 [Collinsella sp. An268]